MGGFFLRAGFPSHYPLQCQARFEDDSQSANRTLIFAHLEITLVRNGRSPGGTEPD